MRRYRYRPRRYRGWKSTSSSKNSILVNLIGRDALNMIIERFYKSSPDELSLILRLYGEEHGSSASKYAQQSIRKWISGTVKISGQTKDRLVKLVPVCLSTDERYIIAKEVCAHYKNKKNKKIDNVFINTDDPLSGLDELSTIVKSFYDADEIIHLPEELTSAITWLADDDVTAARGILAAIEEEEANLIESRAYIEIETLEGLLKIDGKIKLNQTIEFPNGYIKISTFTPKKPFFQRIIASIFGE